MTFSHGRLRPQFHDVPANMRPEGGGLHPADCGRGCGVRQGRWKPVSHESTAKISLGRKDRIGVLARDIGEGPKLKPAYYRF